MSLPPDIAYPQLTTIWTVGTEAALRICAVRPYARQTKGKGPVAETITLPEGRQAMGKDNLALVE